MTLINLADPLELVRWTSINDAVMGGRSLSQIRLDPARVRQVGLVIADRQEGNFSLAIRSIGFEIATP